ncbi:hypothetical protein BV25DRAFT_1819786 [Artomyces pyxidatus]|uniref:Uncharacterized protein n=1 Tax=Artomyces pyxidatus TaxID=48021 RepID=A0ACB8TGA3_9AGAM|nr:hypothetical protein BV25DRAFT_1819786 [Artomyces pyxidatus]
MAGFIDVLSLIFTVSLFVGAIVGVVIVVRKVSQAVDSTKASLREKGWTISDSGVSVKTSKRLNREDYIDATQRGIMKAMSASTFGNASVTNSPNNSPNPNTYTPATKNASVTNLAQNGVGGRSGSISSQSDSGRRGFHLRRAK